MPRSFFALVLVLLTLAYSCSLETGPVRSDATAAAPAASDEDAGPAAASVEGAASGEVVAGIQALHNYAPQCWTFNGVVSPVGQSRRNAAVSLVADIDDDVSTNPGHTTYQLNGADVAYPLGAGLLARPLFRSKAASFRDPCYSNGTQVETIVVDRCGGNATACLTTAQNSSSDHPSGYTAWKRVQFLVWCSTDINIPGAYTRVLSGGSGSAAATYQTVVYPGCTGGLPNACNQGAWGDSCRCGTATTPGCG